MKASSESGECASLISRALPVAGFVGIAVCVHSLSESSLNWGRRPHRYSGLISCQAYWSQRKYLRHTRITERDIWGGFNFSRNRALESKRVAHPAVPGQFCHVTSPLSFRSARLQAGTLAQDANLKAGATCLPRGVPWRFRRKLFRQGRAASTGPANHENVPTIRNRVQSARHRANTPTGHSVARW